MNDRSCAYYSMSPCDYLPIESQRVRLRKDYDLSPPVPARSRPGAGMGDKVDPNIVAPSRHAIFIRGLPGTIKVDEVR